MVQRLKDRVVYDWLHHRGLKRNKQTKSSQSRAKRISRARKIPLLFPPLWRWNVLPSPIIHFCVDTGHCSSEALWLHIKQWVCIKRNLNHFYTLAYLSCAYSSSDDPKRRPVGNPKLLLIRTHTNKRTPQKRRRMATMTQFLSKWENLIWFHWLHTV